jgi:hypothetical protein
MAGAPERFTEHLDLVGPDRSGDGTVLLMTLVHNEAPILPAFLDHYRAMGDVAFLVVDDRSTDGSGDILRAARDVTCLTPREGSTYARDKREWRGQALDRAARDRWVLVPDADEFLIWSGHPHRDLADLCSDLEAEGAEALYAVMLDMYDDRPLGDHVFRGGAPADAFPWFDDPRADPAATWMEKVPERILKTWPTPRAWVLGGMRERLFGTGRDRPLARIARRAMPGWDHDPTPGPGPALRRLLTRAGRGPRPLCLTKLPLLRWRRGTRFSGGAHALRPAHRLAAERGVLLHFPITQGAAGIAHIAARGQHAEGAAAYRRLQARLDASPLYAGSRRLTGPSDLAHLFGVGPPNG